MIHNIACPFINLFHVAYFPSLRSQNEKCSNVTICVPQTVLFSVALLCATHHGNDIHLDTESLQTLYKECRQNDSVTENTQH